MDRCFEYASNVITNYDNNERCHQRQSMTLKECALNKGKRQTGDDYCAMCTHTSATRPKQTKVRSHRCHSCFDFAIILHLAFVITISGSSIGCEFVSFILIQIKDGDWHWCRYAKLWCTLHTKWKMMELGIQLLWLGN